MQGDNSEWYLLDSSINIGTVHSALPSFYVTTVPPHLSVTTFSAAASAKSLYRSSPDKTDQPRV